MRRTPLILGCLLLVGVGLLVLLTGGDEPRYLANPILRHLQPNPGAPAGAEPGAETVAAMRVPPGFRVDLVAAEPRLHQPIAFTFDARGRLWVVEARSYPEKRAAGQGLDAILIFEDGDGDGVFETRGVFAEGLNLVSGLEVGHGGVWVGAAPELLFIPDRDGDDRPDGPPQVLLDGFGYEDTHTTLNNFTWGPDGWLYGNQGVYTESLVGPPGAPAAERTEMRGAVWRLHPVRHEFEIFAHGGSNQWGLDFNDRGQLFMTHCRSRFGGGPTTHVIQGGHYWKLDNRGHAPFVSTTAPESHPYFRNYLRASARYGHGQGGAGEKGSDFIYGGHVHVGTMIYLGDNWPDEYRDHLFTHNLFGRQINHQINKPSGSGYETVHAGQDQLFCTDQGYCPVDLKYGHDGAVYMIDWYDRQKCHSPYPERWDRSNGRLYRMVFAETYTPSKVDLTRMTDSQLIELQNHRNDWHVRTARRLLSERAVAGAVDPAAITALRELATGHAEPARRLRGLWALHAVDALDEALLTRMLRDADPSVRGWTIQLLAEKPNPPASLQNRLLALAEKDPSPVVRLYLASAAQRLPRDVAWQLIEALARHGEDADDANIPKMLWWGLARLMPGDTDRAFAVADTTAIAVLRSYVHWYGARLLGTSLNRVVEMVGEQDGAGQTELLVAIDLAVRDQIVETMPPAWRRIGPTLYESADADVRQRADVLATKFGDESVFPRMRQTLADRGADLEQRKLALRSLASKPDAQSAEIFLGLLDDAELRGDAIAALGRLDHAASAARLIAVFESLSEDDRAATITAMSARASLALPMLEAVLDGRIDRRYLTAFHVRQLGLLGNAAVDAKIAEAWGSVSERPAALEAEITRYMTALEAAPHYLYKARDGEKHYVRLCAQCHEPNADDVLIGPRLAGSGPSGPRYFLESMLDPNGVVGTDYQTVILQLANGDVVYGMVESETPSAITVRTLAGSTVVPKADVRSRTAGQSMMPPGLLNGLREPEVIELLKYLSTL